MTAIGVRIADDVTLYQLPLILLTCGTAITLGVLATRQRLVAETLAAEVTEVQVRSEHERAQAIAEERSHIARELHDIIGHTLSVIAVRAESADRVAQRRPEAASAAVADIADAARSALHQTRRVLSGLRGSGTADLAPAPDLEATRRLVTDLAQAGVAATLTDTGCDDHTPPAVVAGGAHRIVQESLTNAIKHGGPGVTIEVELTCRPHQSPHRGRQQPDAAGRPRGPGIAGDRPRWDGRTGRPFSAAPSMSARPMADSSSTPHSPPDPSQPERTAQ